jgi:membrane protease YdiL (CAAX protease family)
MQLVDKASGIQKACIAIAALFILEIGSTKVYHWIYDIAKTRIPAKEFGLINFSLSFLTQFATFLICLYLVRLFNLALNLEVGFPTNRDRIRNYLILIFVACGAAVLSALSSLILEEFFPKASQISSPLKSYQDALKAQVKPIIIVIGGIILAPIAEEVMFRGFLANLLRKSISPGIAIILSSLLFALFHWSFQFPDFRMFLLYDFGPLAVIGCICSLVYFKYGLISAIITHALCNILSFFLSNTEAVYVVLPGSIVGMFFIISMLITIFRGK